MAASSAAESRGLANDLVAAFENAPQFGKISIPGKLDKDIKAFIGSRYMFKAEDTVLIVSVLDGNDSSLCSRLSTGSFILLVAVFRQTEASWTAHRGFHLLRVSAGLHLPARVIFVNVVQTSLRRGCDASSHTQYSHHSGPVDQGLPPSRRKARIGGFILKQLVTTFLTPQLQVGTRLWCGLLVYELIQGCLKNTLRLSEVLADSGLQLQQLVKSEHYGSLRATMALLAREIEREGCFRTKQQAKLLQNREDDGRLENRDSDASKVGWVRNYLAGRPHCYATNIWLKNECLNITTFTEPHLFWFVDDYVSCLVISEEEETPPAVIDLAIENIERIYSEPYYKTTENRKFRSLELLTDLSLRERLNPTYFYNGKGQNPKSIHVISPACSAENEADRETSLDVMIMRSPLYQPRIRIEEAESPASFSEDPACIVSAKINRPQGGNSHETLPVAPQSSKSSTESKLSTSKRASLSTTAAIPIKPRKPKARRGRIGKSQRTPQAPSSEDEDLCANHTGFAGSVTRRLPRSSSPPKTAESIFDVPTSPMNGTNTRSKNIRIRPLKNLDSNRAKGSLMSKKGGEISRQSSLPVKAGSRSLTKASKVMVESSPSKVLPRRSARAQARCKILQMSLSNANLGDNTETPPCPMTPKTTENNVQVVSGSENALTHVSETESTKIRPSSAPSLTSLSVLSEGDIGTPCRSQTSTTDNCQEKDAHKETALTRAKGQSIDEDVKTYKLGAPIHTSTVAMNSINEPENNCIQNYGGIPKGATQGIVGCLPSNPIELSSSNRSSESLSENLAAAVAEDKYDLAYDDRSETSHLDALQPNHSSKHAPADNTLTFSEIEEMGSQLNKAVQSALTLVKDAQERKEHLIGFDRSGPQNQGIPLSQAKQLRGDVDHELVHENLEASSRPAACFSLTTPEANDIPAPNRRLGPYFVKTKKNVVRETGNPIRLGGICKASPQIATPTKMLDEELFSAFIVDSPSQNTVHEPRSTVKEAFLPRQNLREGIENNIMTSTPRKRKTDEYKVKTHDLEKKLRDESCDATHPRKRLRFDVETSSPSPVHHSRLTSPKSSPVETQILGSSELTSENIEDEPTHHQMLVQGLSRLSESILGHFIAIETLVKRSLEAYRNIGNAFIGAVQASQIDFCNVYATDVNTTKNNLVSALGDIGNGLERDEQHAAFHLSELREMQKVQQAQIEAAEALCTSDTAEYI